MITLWFLLLHDIKKQRFGLSCNPNPEVIYCWVGCRIFTSHKSCMFSPLSDGNNHENNAFLFPLETLSIIGCKIMRTHFSQTHQNLDMEEFFFFCHSRIMSLNIILHLSPVLGTSQSQSKSSHYFLTRNHPSFSQDDFSSSLPLCISAFIAFSWRQRIPVQDRAASLNSFFNYESWSCLLLSVHIIY